MTEVRQTKRLLQPAGEAIRRFDERQKESWASREPQFRETARHGGYVGTIVANIVILYIFQNLLVWEIPYITGAWVDVLPALTLSITATIVANIAFLGYDAHWFRHLWQIGLNLLGLQATYALYTVFPFDFYPHVANSAVRLGLLIAVVGTLIGLIVETVQIFTGHLDREH